MAFNNLFEQSIRKYMEGGTAENIAYEIGYKITTEKMPLIVSSKPDDEAYGYWKYETEDQVRMAQYTVSKHRNIINVTLYISKKGHNTKYDDYNKIPNTQKSWQFKLSSPEKKIEEIAKYINKAILADKKGKTIQEH